jgi:hypothetical protein
MKFTTENAAERAERELRALWTVKGVTKERQDAIIAEVTAAAQPGAWVGPFQIPQDKPEAKL